VPRWFRRFLVALATLVALVLLVVAAWAVDVRASDGEVVRRTRLADRDISGLTRAQLDAIVDDVAQEFEGADIRVVAGDAAFTTDASTLGVSVSPRPTIDAAFDVGRAGNVPTRLVGWIRSFLEPREVSLRVAVDRAAAYRTVREEDPGPREEATEPSITLKDGRLVVADGKNGKGIDARNVIAAIPDAAAAGAPYVVRVERGEVEPRWRKEDVEALIERVRKKVATPLPVKAGSTTANVPASTARSWFRSRATDDGLELYLDEKAAIDGLAEALKAAGSPATETKFTVEGGSVRIIPGKSGTKCCAPAAVARVERVLLADTTPRDPVELPLTERQPSLTESEAAALKIVEPVATFSTNHPPGQPRVQNIHRIADLIRGQVIEPGGSFSVNNFVGRRTRDKGFVDAPVIEEGRFSEGVGGGISQFATTLFNAAFFAGLEFGEYQSHSIYISRYPYGREATLSYPHPDLIVKNPSPHGVLIWPTYNDRSITVTLYSTKWVEATQSGQSKAQRGNCTRVTTERTRRFVADGRTAVDRVFATYRPAEGVNC
jgi:vancomycin resistance protein YoaR